MSRFFRWEVLSLGLALSLWLGGFSGCSHYNLGRPHRPDFETLFIEPVHNSTFVAQAQPLIGQSVANAFAREGTIEISSKQDADAIMSINIIGFDKVVSTFGQSDTMQAQAYEVSLTVSVTLQSQLCGKIYLDNVSIKTHTQVYVNSGDIQAEYEALPVLARDLGLKIVNETLGIW